MEARILRRALSAAIAVSFVALVVCQSPALGASYRTANFIVSTRSAEFAKQVGNQAEVFRRELAIEWLGRELPNWGQPCPIRVDVGANKGAGGATTFMFEQNRPFGWTMEIQGSEERILDSVLPHEITHTIFATHFGRPLPRWADEGACTTVECDSEKANHERMLRRYLTSTPSRGIAFNRMVMMTEYPHDIMPLYAQGHSVVQFLLYHGGKQKFVEFLGDGMQRNSWDTAISSHYGYQDLSDLQVKWVEWVRRGSPAFDPNHTDPSGSGPGELATAAPPAVPQANLLLANAAPNQSVQPPASPRDSEIVIRGQAPKKTGLFGSLTGSDSWYARQRNVTAATEEAIPVATDAASSDPHQGPGQNETLLPQSPTHQELVPVPLPSTSPAATSPPVRSPDQRPKPLVPNKPTSTLSDSHAWQPAGTSVVRKVSPDKLDRQPADAILFDAPIRQHGTFWR